MKSNHIFFVALLLINTVALAQRDSIQTELVEKRIPLTFAYQEIIHSKILNQDKKINICLPENFYEVSSQHTYPVLLLLENEFFQMVSGVVKHLSSVERMPETIVVSITDEPSTPTVYTNGSDFWPKDWKQIEGKNPDPFTKYLREELFPYLKNNYRANDFKMIMGLSGTSIYALHTFVKESDLFNAHIAIAAGDILGMGYNEGESYIDLIVDNLNRTPQRKGYLYVTSADSDGGGNSPMIKANLEELENRLSTYRTENFHFISKIFPNEGHYDVALPALEEALAMVFPKEKWFAKYSEIIKLAGSAMKNLDDYYLRLSGEYGFKVLPRAERWNSINRLSWVGPFLLRQGNNEEAIEINQRWVRYCPKSTTALSELAKAYEANGELNKAISVLEKAQDMTSDINEEESRSYKVRITHLKEKNLKSN